MPMLTVQLAAPPSSELSRSVARSLTQLTSTVLHKDPRVTVVNVDYVDPDRWFAGGGSAPRGYFVEIRVTDGTNTKNEKAEYIARVHAALESLLGPCGPASYVQVAEVNADAYGYGGLTAERRYVVSQPVATPA